MKLFTMGNPKILKGRKLGYISAVLHLAPYDLSGFQVCGAADGCQIPCLNTAGRGGIIKKGENTNRIQEARIRKTREFFLNRDEFMGEMVSDVRRVIRYAEKLALIPCIRLNGTSDIPWEKIRVTVEGIEYRNIFEAFPHVQFYDYTKIFGRKNLPANYHLTFSRSASNELSVVKAIQAGINVAVVFDKLPRSFMGKPVIDGDDTDLRFLDQKGSIVGLKAKGKAKSDFSGFVVRA